MPLQRMPMMKGLRDQSIVVVTVAVLLAVCSSEGTQVMRARAFVRGSSVSGEMRLGAPNMLVPAV